MASDTDHQEDHGVEEVKLRLREEAVTGSYEQCLAAAVLAFIEADADARWAMLRRHAAWLKAA